VNSSIVRVINANNTYEDKQMTDKEIVEELLNGASLRTFMMPDSSIPSNYPEHIETYDLPHIIVSGEYFWGKSETAHLTSQLRASAFCYTNIDNIFCSYNPMIHKVFFMSKKRYKTHKWYLREDYTLIWDSEKDNPTDSIKKEIESCSKFKIAMLDSEDIWNIHPVDLPMYYLQEGKFELKTVMDEYPIFFRYVEETKKHVSNNSEFLSAKPDDNMSLGYELFNEFFTFYSLSSDGSYYNYFDVPRGTKQKYKRLKIYVDRING